MATLSAQSSAQPSAKSPSQKAFINYHGKIYEVPYPPIIATSNVGDTGGRIDTSIKAGGDPTIQVSVFDRGYLYGDSLYEVVRTYRQKIFALDLHLNRLAASARLNQTLITQTTEQLGAMVQATLDAALEKNPNAEFYIRIIVSRGIGAIGFGLENLRSPTIPAIICHEFKEPTDEQVQRGMHLGVATRARNHPRALDPAMKSGNYLNSLLAFLETKAARPGGAEVEDAIICDLDGDVTEGTTFNIGYIKNKILVTPPLDIGILDGITRQQVLKLAPAFGLQTREVRFPPSRFFEADEVFALSTLKEVFPVSQIDGQSIANGKPGKYTMKLREKFHDWAVRSSLAS